MKPTWQTSDGSVRMWLGDALEVLPTLEAGSVDMIWTDPPYGHGNADGDLLSRRGEAVGDGIKTRHEPIQNDSPETMRLVVDGALREAARILKHDCCCCCCCCCGGGGPSPTFAWVANRMDAEGLAFFHSVIWDKRNPGMGWRYRRQHEMVMVAHRRGGRLLWANDQAAVPNIVSHYPPRDRIHPNEKPLQMVEEFVTWHTERGQLVADPFMGSGTTGIACIRTGRRFIGIEKEPKYFDIAVKRIEAELSRAPLFEPAPEIQTTFLDHLTQEPNP